MYEKFFKVKNSFLKMKKIKIQKIYHIISLFKLKIQYKISKIIKINKKCKYKFRIQVENYSIEK